MKAGTKLAESAAMRRSHAHAKDIPRPRRPVHRSYHRLLERANREDIWVIGLTETRADVARRLPELRQVLADAESTSGAGDDDRADVGTTGLLQGCCESLVDLGVGGVDRLGD